MKKTSKQTQLKFSAENYIKTCARDLPLGKCYISRPVIDSPTCFAVVTRLHTSGNMTIGLFVIDNYGKGLTDAIYMFNQQKEEIEFIQQKFRFGGELTETSYEEVHNKIYEAVAFGEEAGFRPKREWNVSQYILEEDDDNVPLMEMKFGWKGIHLFMVFNDDEAKKIEDIVSKHLQQEEYAIVIEDSTQEIGCRTYCGDSKGFVSRVVMKP